MKMALAWYTNELYRNHVNTFLTAARIEVIRRNLFELQKLQQTRETNPVWGVPVEISVNLDAGQFEVVVSDENSVLYLDF